MPEASASGASTSNGSARQRDHQQGKQERTFTEEQARTVLRIRRCQATAFYDILELERSCDDTKIKKAYRKLSLLTHPDKNGHKHADEAFKMVARAFSVLGDKEKRDKFDRSGMDPDSRFAQAQQADPFSGFARRNPGRPSDGGARAGMWDDEISPEEMFARFFGGGFGGGYGGGPFGGAFDAGPQFVFNLGGGPGIRVHQFGGARPRARPRNAERQQPDAGIASTVIALLPILLLFIVPLLSSLFSGGLAPSTPTMVFDTALPPLYTQERTTPNLKAKYFVNPQDIQQYSPAKLATLDKKAELNLVSRVRSECENERQHKQRLREAAQGWFYQDPEKLELAERYEMPSCRRLKTFGF